MKEVKLGPQITFTKLDDGTVVIRIHPKEAHISPAKWAEIIAELEQP